MPALDDDRLFAAEALVVLRRAAEEAAWLIGRGYAPETTFALVADRHGLEGRQRVAVERGICADWQYRRRVARELEPEDVARRPLRIDGENMLATIEAALAGRLLLRSVEGTVRDLDWKRGEHVPSDATDAALDRIGDALASLRPKLARWYFQDGAPGADASRQRVLERNALRAIDVRLVANVVETLGTAAHVATSDPAILDTCASWFNLGGRVLERLPDARVIALA